MLFLQPLHSLLLLLCRIFLLLHNFLFPKGICSTGSLGWFLFGRFVWLGLCWLWLGLGRIGCFLLRLLVGLVCLCWRCIDLPSCLTHCWRSYHFLCFGSSRLVCFEYKWLSRWVLWCIGLVFLEVLDFLGLISHFLLLFRLLLFELGLRLILFFLHFTNSWTHKLNNSSDN